MQIIRPSTATPEMVATNAADADPQWISSSTYADKEKATHKQRVWLSLQSSNTGHEPGLTESVAWWSDAGPSNSWAMFDDEVQSVTSNAEAIVATVTPVNAKTVGFLNLKGTSVRVVSESGAGILYDQTRDLWNYKLITDYDEYFFGEHEFKSEAVFSGLPLYPDQSITVTVSNPDGVAQCGLVVFGQPVDVGLEKVGLQRSGVDYSQVTFDPFGKPSITKRAYARKVSTQTLIENKDLDRITKRLDQLASTPVLVLSGQPRFDSMIVFGLVSYSIDLALYQYSYVSFDVKGYV